MSDWITESIELQKRANLAAAREWADRYNALKKPGEPRASVVLKRDEV